MIIFRSIEAHAIDWARIGSTSSMYVHGVIEYVLSVPSSWGVAVNGSDVTRHGISLEVPRPPLSAVAKNIFASFAASKPFDKFFFVH